MHRHHGGPSQRSRINSDSTQTFGGNPPLLDDPGMPLSSRDSISEILDQSITMSSKASIFLKRRLGKWRVNASLQKRSLGATSGSGEAFHSRAKTAQVTVRVRSPVPQFPVSFGVCHFSARRTKSSKTGRPSPPNDNQPVILTIEANTRTQ